MAAIYGIVGDAGSPELSAMGQRLEHRGESVREWAPAPGCLLGHRADTSSALQNDSPIAFDGHLDNGPELAAMLGLPQDHPCPEQLLLTLIDRFGPEGARYLEGQFAFAVWASTKQRLLLFRDRYGVRPLFATRSRGRYLFASEYKALLAIPDVAAEPNRDAVRHVQCTKYPMADATLLAGVSPVRRSAWTAVTATTEETTRYWTPKVAIPTISDSQHVDALRSRFLEVTRRQVRNFDVIGVQLSGGFDSGFVLASICKVAPEVKVHTFTAGYGPDDPEMIDAERLAQQFGTDHHPLVLHPEDIPDLLPTTVWHMEDLYGREEMVYLYMLAREASKHVQMLIAGYAADMTLGGMPRHLVARFAMRFPPARSTLAEFYRHTQTGLLPRSMMGRALMNLYHRGRRDYPPPQVLGSDHEPQTDPLKRAGTQPFSEFLARGIEDDLAWEQIEQLHAAWGMSFNAPFMNPEYLEGTLTIPDRLKLRGLTQKYAIRQAAKGIVPTDVQWRHKTLQRLRHDERFSSAIDRLADRLLDRASVRTRGLFDVQTVDRLRQRPANGKPYSTAQAYRLWTLIETELWCRIFVDQRGERVRTERPSARRGSVVSVG
jgi:asparagine synthase (glutamine-hydrolysing)